MDAEWIAVAQRCLNGAEEDAMTFPAIVGSLMEAGFDGYAVDFRLGSAIYYRPDGDAVALPVARRAPRAALDIAEVRAAIREAQTLAPGYSYRGFCAKVTAAGCSGYLVSFPGRRVVYFGRDGETHVERFPD